MRSQITTVKPPNQGLDNRTSAYDRKNWDKRRAYEENVRKSRHGRDRDRMQKKRGEAKRFLAWDGEGSSVPNGEAQPYMLFGNSDGQYVKMRQLRTRSCLNLILRSPKNCIHFGFAFGYDVNQILIDLSLAHLSRLAKTNRCRWKPDKLDKSCPIYHLEYIPGKWFRVSCEGVTRTIYDVFNFFNRALADVLDEYKIGTEVERKYLREQKLNRPHFTWDEINEVIEYWTLEGRLMVELMEYMRRLFNDAGFYPTSWHGPGALARQMLKNHGIRDCKLDTRKLAPAVWIAARYGFTGGRFQQWLAGLYEGDVYNYDIHSAYPYAIQFLPNLATGRFHHNLHVDRATIEAERFAIYHIRYDAHRLEKSIHSYHYKNRPRPLFRRLKNNNVYWPDAVEGWYWSPEAELVKDDPAATFVEAWEFEDDGTRPLAFIADIYAKREYHKALGNAIEYGFKLAMNSGYGQFAQRAGWKNQRPPGPPPFHQLEWAGYVTSMCKAMVYKVATYAYDQGGLITIDTDGVFSTVPIPDHILPNGIGDGLGQWEEQKYQGILIWQNGFYWLKKGQEWSKARSRGAPRGKVPVEAAWEALESAGPIKFNRTEFIGFKTALKNYGRRWRSWTATSKDIDFGGGPGSKMVHIGNPLDGRNAGRCQACLPTASLGKWRHPMHNLTARNVSYGEYHGKYVDTWSYKHKLPWLEMDDKTAEDQEDEALMKIYEDLSL
jgi:DNA polymerase type B, organellar and viral